METPKTQLEAIRYFSDEEVCHAYLVDIRWNGTVTCPHCHSDKVGKFSGKRKVSNCKSCKKQFTVKLGTIFEDSALPLSKWLPAMWLIVNAKNGISSCEIGRSLGVTQKSAWFMGHRIRLAIQQGSLEKFKGEVEADETYVGGLSRFKHASKRNPKGVTGGVGKVAVQGLLQRNGKNGSQVKTKVLKGFTRPHIQSGVRQHVEAGSNLYTDALHAYTELQGEYVHAFIDHADTYVNGQVHTNGLENFWSLFKRCVKGTYVCPRAFHLSRYLDEQVYRFNDRKMNDGERFKKAVSQIAGKRITYRNLIEKSSGPSLFPQQELPLPPA